MDPITLLYRLDHGYSVHRALTQPVRKVDRLITIDGKTQRISDFAKEFGIQFHVVRYRLDAGMSAMDALKAPVRKWKRKSPVER